MWANFSSSFAVLYFAMSCRCSSNVVIKFTTLPQIKSVAALPCEIGMFSFAAVQKLVCSKYLNHIILADILRYGSRVCAD